MPGLPLGISVNAFCRLIRPPERQSLGEANTGSTAFRKMTFTIWFGSDGYCDQTSAQAPETYGAAIDVPLVDA